MDDSRDVKRVCIDIDVGEGIEVSGPVTIRSTHKSGRRTRLVVEHRPGVRVERVVHDPLGEPKGE